MDNIKPITPHQQLCSVEGTSTASKARVHGEMDRLMYGQSETNIPPNKYVV